MQAYIKLFSILSQAEQGKARAKLLNDLPETLKDNCQKKPLNLNQLDTYPLDTSNKAE
jgi:hypothetical protein